VPLRSLNEPVFSDDASEVRRLRAGIRDLTAMSTMPAQWVGREAPEIVASFLDTLVATMHLDLAFMHAEDPKGGPIEAVRTSYVVDLTDRLPSIAQALAPYLGTYTQTRITNPLDGSDLWIVSHPLPASEGVVVAGSRNPKFPSDLEMALFATGVTHAATWLRSAHVAAEHVRAQAQNVYLREEIEVALAFGGIVGHSTVLRRVLDQLELVAPTEANVLLLGESGTGKELFAREIHHRSRRADRPLIKVNCSAIPRDMFETEFFGHVRGAFTGALRDRPGRFQLAEGGTLFLDEVGDLPIELQPKLLRVLQEGQYERVGDDTTRQVDVRVIAATNRNLAAEADAGQFRADLYYRLSVFPIAIPALRERTDDIPLLVRHFVALVAKKLGIEVPVVMGDQFERLKRHDWGGNIRELQNMVERAVILSRGGKFSLDAVLAERTPLVREEIGEEVVPEREWRRRERENLLVALKRAAGKIYGPSGAAALLGVKPSTLQSRLRALGIDPYDSK